MEIAIKGEALVFLTAWNQPALPLPAGTARPGA